ncbi:MAG TPA: hypothetical protein P5555_01435 [Candidatus Paceibacterota bacterium]|nr:hypothetical protein [Verrucomicrobiota bacterium]HRZ43836.1 hypothetical protein [Candidatus Paceibacterota bacterium]HRZ93083.1 hypothetical protein [Candidatus Paceibacterota bacterium]
MPGSGASSSGFEAPGAAAAAQPVPRQNDSSPDSRLEGPNGEPSDLPPRSAGERGGEGGPRQSEAQREKDCVRRIRAQMPEGGLFARHTWRTAAAPFAVGAEMARSLEQMGRVLLQFYRAANRLYELSVEGRQPAWVASWLDQGKPSELVARQRAEAFQRELPSVIRPDLLWTEEGLALVELDSVPGGIGLTGWLNRAYAREGWPVLGGEDGMVQGFASIFGGARRVHIVISEEAATYRPEMVWLSGQIPQPPMAVRGTDFTDFAAGDAVYRFFELFDLPQVACAEAVIGGAAAGRLRMTPPPKPLFEEKLLLALLWNRNLREFWRRELGEGFFRRMQEWVPYTWVVDPAPLPAQGSIPGLELTDWRQLGESTQRERELVLKVSGFSERAWGSRGVYYGADLSQSEWRAAVEEALASFPRTPYILQRFRRPKPVAVRWYDPGVDRVESMAGRVRLCPYYFVAGRGDGARARLGGVLATVCPADKKIIHGMSTAVLAPCRA